MSTGVLAVTDDMVTNSLICFIFYGHAVTTVLPEIMHPLSSINFNIYELDVSYGAGISKI
jgi:hypothetical protein